MAIARMHGGPLDGQILPLDNVDMERMIVPYGATQVIYRKMGEPTNTGPNDGPTEVAYWFVDASDDIVPSDD